MGSGMTSHLSNGKPNMFETTKQPENLPIRESLLTSSSCLEFTARTPGRSPARGPSAPAAPARIGMVAGPPPCLSGCLGKSGGKLQENHGNPWKKLQKSGDKPLRYTQINQIHGISPRKWGFPITSLLFFDEKKGRCDTFPNKVGFVRLEKHIYIYLFQDKCGKTHDLLRQECEEHISRIAL